MLVPTNAAAAMAFAARSPSACVVTVWPSGTGQLPAVHGWLRGAGVSIVHETTVPLTSAAAELLAVMALYDGEEWLESNCWYMEQPLL